jgi:hypothetical protein
MMKFDNINKQQRMYDFLIEKSFRCKTPNDAQKLIDIFEKYEWDDSNYRMLEWVLSKNLDNQIFNEKNRLKVPYSLFEKADNSILSDFI